MPYVEKLKMIKEEKGLSNADISRIGDIPLPTVTRVFNGQTPNPTFETITRIAIAMGVSLDELAGLKQPNETSIASPIETTLNSYSQLLSEKDDRIKELKDERDYERKARYKMTCAFVVFALIVLLILAVDIFNGHFGYFRH